MNEFSDLVLKADCMTKFNTAHAGVKYAHAYEIW